MDLERLIRERQSLPCLKEGVRHYQEAEACYSRGLAGVPAVPADANFYQGRAVTRLVFHQVIAHLRHPNGQDAATATMDGLTPWLDDCGRYCALKAADPQAILETVVWEWMVGQMALGEAPTIVPQSWRPHTLPIRRGIEEATRLLEPPDPVADCPAAARGLAVAGGIRYTLLGDQAAAERDWRRAIELDPHAERSWHGLTGILLAAGRYTELVALCQDHLKYEETYGNHLMLAKAFDCLHQTDKAEEQVLAAARLAPDEAIPQLAVAVIWIRNAAPAEKIDAQLARVEKLSAKEPANRALRSDLALMRALHLALQDRKPEAREQLLQALFLDSHNSYADEIAAAIGR
jgi:tetratricopeptide (TPR) repeat protein